MRTVFYSRMLFVGFLFGAAVLLVVYRLFVLQVLSHGELVRESSHQENTRADTHLSRGSIYFTTKEGVRVSAGTLMSGYTLVLVPSRVENKTLLKEELASVGIAIDPEVLEKKLSKLHSKYEVIAEKVSEEKGKALISKGIPGIQVIQSTWRHYPGNERAAQAVGFVSFLGDKKEGRLGLELQYNAVLSRTRNALTENFFTDLFSDVSTTVSGDTREGDIVTSIEPTVQAEVERVLGDIQRAWNSEEVFAVVMDARTGEIRALATTNAFDLNSFNTLDDMGKLKNPVHESVFEMGSIVKILTYAAGYDSGVITEKSTYTDTGSRTLDKKTFYNFDKKARGTISLEETLRQSLNLGAAEIALRVGYPRMRSYFLEKFKLGEETGIDLPGEVPGIVTNLANDRAIEFATASFGQGIATTPLATLRALTAVANGGTLVVPHVVTDILYPGGFSKKMSYEDQREKVLHADTSLAVSRILTSVVDTKLNEGKLKIPHLSVAAKTGTAQIAKPRGGYYEDKYNHTFFGYFPAYDPQFTILLVNREPKNVQYSSETLAKPFMTLVQFLANYYSVPADR